MMRPEIDKWLEKLPENGGVFCLKNAGKQTLFVGAAANIREDLSAKFLQKPFSEAIFQEQISELEILEGSDLIKLFARTIRERDPIYNISLAGETRFPYLKITREDFPRILATRRIADDNADYFGAFLPATGVRFWLEFINRAFRLRTCEIAIDGNFPSPCTQFYAKRCVAPCVKSLCDRESYLEIVELVRLFLQNERERFAEVLTEKIEAAASILEFERAGEWRDILRGANEVFAAKDWQLWLADTVDTFEIEEKETEIFVYLVVQRGRRTLGKKVFVFEKKLGARETLAQVVWQFYEFHAPQEIRVPFDFPNRKLLAKTLSRRDNRQVKITIINAGNERKTSRQALKRAKFDFDLRQIKPPVKTEDITLELKNLFGLSREPRKIEAFDAAHISGKDFTAGKTVWENGKFLTSENEFWLLDEVVGGEPESLEKAIRQRFGSSRHAFPDLLLVDGGKSQLQAALKALSFLNNREFAICGVVKPPQRHGEISHFILENGRAVKFSKESEAMRVLLLLRDEAHELANKVHRQRRESSHFYELAKILPSADEGERRRLLQKFGSLKNLSLASREDLGKLLDAERTEIVLKDLKANRKNGFSEVKPLIVPIRFDDPNGDAKDLQPLGYTKIG